MLSLILPRELADRLLPVTKAQGTKVTSLKNSPELLIILPLILIIVVAVVVMIVIGFVVIAVNHSATEFMKVIVLDDTWWADPRLGDLSEPLPPPLVEVVPSPYCQYSHQCCLSN